MSAAFFYMDSFFTFYCNCGKKLLKYMDNKKMEKCYRVSETTGNSGL